MDTFSRKQNLSVVTYMYVCKVQKVLLGELEH